MAYIPHTWLPRLGTGLNRYVDQNGNILYLTASPESVTQEGTPFSADWMNHMEEGIAGILNVGDAAPTSATPGEAGRFYITNTGVLWYCTAAVDNARSWARIAVTNADGILPASVIPALDYIPTKQKGAAGGVASLDESGRLPLASAPITHRELARFTASGTFKPSSYPTADGRYDILLQGGGGSGSSASSNANRVGGEAGGIVLVHGLPLISGQSYAVTVGAGGAPVNLPSSNSVLGKYAGKNGGDTAFSGFTAPGGRGGEPGLTANTANGYTQNLGGAGSGQRGGASQFAVGGLNSTSGAGAAGSLGSGGGASAMNYDSGAGGDGVVIICGWIGGR